MQNKEDMITVKVSELKQLCMERLRDVQVPEEEAERIADILIESDQRGVHSHGVVCLARYINLMKKGEMKKRLQFHVLNDSGASVVLDGEHSNGQLLGVQGMEIAIERAGTYGIAAVGVRNSSHFGAGA